MTITTGALCALAIVVGLLGLRVAWLVGALFAVAVSVVWSGSPVAALVGALSALAAVGLALLNNYLDRRHDEVHGDDQDY